MLKASFLPLLSLLPKIPSRFPALSLLLTVAVEGGRCFISYLTLPENTLSVLVLRWNTEVLLLLLLRPEEGRNRVSREQPDLAAGAPPQCPLPAGCARAGQGSRAASCAGCSVPGCTPGRSLPSLSPGGAVGAHPPPHMQDHWFSSALQHSSQQGKTTGTPEGNGL